MEVGTIRAGVRDGVVNKEAGDAKESRLVGQHASPTSTPACPAPAAAAAGCCPGDELAS